MQSDNFKRSPSKSRKSPFKEGSRHTIAIHGLGSSGEGVGSIDGYTVFVHGALPGEKVEVCLTECHTRYAHANLVAIGVASPRRVKPPCPLFSRCGGCQLMHLAYEEQLHAKRQRVYDALQRIGKIDASIVDPCVASPQPLYYRNKVQLPVQKMDGRSVAGFYARASHAFIEVPACMIHCKQGEEVYHGIQKLLLASPIEPFDPKTGSGELKHIILKSAQKTGQTLVVLITNRTQTTELCELAEQIGRSSPLVRGVVHNIQSKITNVILGDSYEVLYGEESIEETLLGLRFTISAASFFQVNPLQAENLYQKALALAAPAPTETILDAYCGVGTLSCVFAPHARCVIGVECVAKAIDDARKNAALNGIANASFTVASAETFIHTLPSIDTVLLNPPRAGCDPSLLKALPSLSPKKIVYISCDPATLARDLGLLESVGFKTMSVTPFDMFPQTSHVETVVLLTSSAL